MQEFPGSDITRRIISQSVSFTVKLWLHTQHRLNAISLEVITAGIRQLLLWAYPELRAMNSIGDAAKGQRDTGLTL